jgi:hypothetical protein
MFHTVAEGSEQKAESSGKNIEGRIKREEYRRQNIEGRI